MLLFYLAVFLIPMITIRKRTKDDKVVLDSYSTTCLKGLICIYVLLHNVGLDYEGNSEIIETVCEHTGGIGVGIFFFLSAFGIIRSYQTKGNRYLGRLLLVHCVKLFIISFSINLLIYLVYHQGQFETNDLLLRLFNLDVFNDFNRMNRHGWYISTIMGMYIIFAVVYFICSKLKTDKKFYIAGFILAAFAVGFRVGAWIADEGGMYTRELPCFALGCIYAMYYDKINNFFNKYFWLSFVVLFICFQLGFFLWEPLGAYASCALIILLSQRITYKNNVMFFLGKMCIYIYLFVHFAQMGLQVFRGNVYWWTITNIGVVLVMSLIFYLTEYLIKKGFNFLKVKFIKN